MRCNVVKTLVTAAPWHPVTEAAVYFVPEVESGTGCPGLKTAASWKTSPLQLGLSYEDLDLLNEVVQERDDDVGVGGSDGTHNVGSKVGDLVCQKVTERNIAEVLEINFDLF